MEATSSTLYHGLSAGYYFITFSTYHRQSLLPSQKDCVFNDIRFLDSKKYEILAVVVLNDHVHMIINPMDALPKIMHSIKSFSAHQINKISDRKGKVWQDENYDRVIRNEYEFLEKINYRGNCKSPTMSFPRRFWAGIYLVTA